MKKQLANELSKNLSWLLRHGLVEAKINYDNYGWANVDDVINFLNVSIEDLLFVVSSNNKDRFAIDGTMIRANQGHSIKLNNIEESWTKYIGTDVIFHGTMKSNVPSIMANGILPGKRTHVHLAKSIDSKVGKRYNVDVVLEVNPAIVRQLGVEIFESANGVVLAKYIPKEAICREILV